MWYKNLGGTFVRFVTIHAVTDGQTDTTVIGKTGCILQCGKNKQNATPTMFCRLAELSTIKYLAEVLTVACKQLISSLPSTFCGMVCSQVTCKLLDYGTRLCLCCVQLAACSFRAHKRS